MNGIFQFDRYRSTTAAFIGWLARRRIWKGRRWTNSAVEMGTAVPMVLRNFFAFRPNLQTHNLAIQVAAYLHTHTKVTWGSSVYRQLGVFLRETSVIQQRAGFLTQINVQPALYQLTSLSTFQARAYRIQEPSTLATTRVRNHQNQVWLLTTSDLRSHDSTERIHFSIASIQHSSGSRAFSWQKTNVYANALYLQTSPFRQPFTGTSYTRQVIQSHWVSHARFTIQQASLYKPAIVAAIRSQTFVPVEHRAGSLLLTKSVLDKQSIENSTTRTLSNS